MGVNSRFIRVVSRHLWVSSCVLAGFLSLGELARADVPRFTALCKPDTARRFDYYTLSDGEEKGPKWSDNERFLDSQPWSLVYDGKDKLEVDGVDYVAFQRADSILSAVAVQSAPGADNTRVWVINLDMGRALHSHLQVGDLLGTNLMGRLVEFRCEVSRYN